MTRGGTSAAGSHPVVLRQSGAVLVPVAVYVFCAAVVVDSLVEDGTTTSRLRLAASMASVAYLAWMFLASPSLVVESGGVRVVNPLRAHWVPFEVLDDLEVRGLTTVVARGAGGRTRRFTSWNGPGVPRRFEVATPPVAAAVERRRGAWERGGARNDAEARVCSTWRWRPLAGLLVLALATVTIWWQ